MFISQIQKKFIYCIPHGKLVQVHNTSSFFYFPFPSPQNDSLVKGVMQ